MQLDRPSPRRLFLMMSLAIAAVGCANSPPPASDSPREVVAKESRVADWNQLAKALSGLAGACGVVGKSRDGEATGIALPAECLFGREGSTLTDGSRPAVVAIARELKRVADREFWIAARAGAPTRDAARVSSARATALVNALVAAGVSPHRLAAVVGFGDEEATVYDGPATLTGAALVEIIVAPSREEIPSSIRSGVR